MSSTMDAFKHVFVNSTLFMAAADHKPFYFVDRTDILETVPDKYLNILIPLVVYWACAIPFDILDYLSPSLLEKYRIHESAEVQSRNRVTKSQVVVTVLFQQFLQILLGLVVLEENDYAKMDHPRSISKIQTFLVDTIGSVLGQEGASQFASTSSAPFSAWLYWWGIPAFQLVVAMFVMDTWQYTLHRLFHVVPFLYSNIHSWHHRLYVPFAYGALYNHPFEGFLFDLLGSYVSILVAGMTLRQSTFFFGVATAKTIHDHCGWSLPFDPMQFLFKNNADYHDIHHQFIGLKSNFSQPFFVHWDTLLGTEMTRDQFEAKKKANRAKTKVA